MEAGQLLSFRAPDHQEAIRDGLQQRNPVPNFFFLSSEAVPPKANSTHFRGNLVPKFTLWY